jgi:SAM-dependent methyltransferase
MNKLNLGCGDDYRIDYINVDIGECRKDVDHNLEEVPYPFDNDQFDEILMQQSIEHISRENFPKLVEELYRITRPGGKIFISAPYYLSRNAYTDFTHKNFMTEESFSYFDPRHPLFKLGKIYGCTAKFKVDVKLDRDRLHPETNIFYNLEVIK